MFKASVQEARLDCERPLGYCFFFSRLAAGREMGFAESGRVFCCRGAATDDGLLVESGTVDAAERCAQQRQRALGPLAFRGTNRFWQ
jgi:hypothetical protein